jgi:hypothetical protein
LSLEVKTTFDEEDLSSERRKAALVNCSASYTARSDVLKEGL